MVRVGEITPNRLVAVAAGTALGLGIAACGSNKSSSSETSVNKVTAAAQPTAAHLAAINNEAARICAEAPFSVGDYNSEIGAHAMAPLSFAKDPKTGDFVFTSADPNNTAEKVANALGHNTLATAIAYSELEVNHTGIVPADMATHAADTFNQMMGSSTVREQDCKVVVSTILTSPEQFKFHPHTGEIITFTPVYDDNHNLTDLNGVTTPMPGSSEVFNAAPLAGSNDEALQKSVAENWGITPQGDIIATSEKEGSMKPSNHGKPAKVTSGGNVKMTTNGNVVHLNAGGSSSGTTGKGANGSGVHNPSQAHGHTPEKLKNGSSTGKTGTGPKGQGKESHPGKQKSPGQGGGGGEVHGGGSSSTTGTTTGPNTGTIPGGSSSTGNQPPATTTHNQPPATTTHNQPPATTTQSSTTPATSTTTQSTSTPATSTTTGSKGTPPPCIPNPPYVICN